MISAKKLLKLTRKWQKMAAIRRRRITSPQKMGSNDTRSCSTSSMAKKGHFVVYFAYQKRFLLPLEYLNSKMIKELFNMAEEEFGLQSEGPLTLPCDTNLMEYAITLIRQNATRDVERALLMSIASSCCSSFFHFQHQATSHQLPICSF
ncbi:auxin-responsive protein SAUR68-like [Hevea brasiliensis]|uniref:auxin-responsive protein SAUR68-like n=1 Tax=Hevea brasiliensis TaxID=3981 RepID=UPI0025E50777|nr:auxin-responsive protein SAUR68-like [Hevea brasiliensis]